MCVYIYNRTLRNIIKRKAGDFWGNVINKHRIDLSEYNLPGCAYVEFSFVDPIFVWIQRVNDLLCHNIPVQWSPCKMVHSRTHEEYFGSGVQYGLLFRSAARDIPSRSSIALMNISWDGGSQGIGARSSTPILLQVMNTNSMSAKAVALLGYLPTLEVAKGYKEHKDYIAAKKFLLQVCIHTLLCVYTQHIICVHWCVYTHNI